MHALLQISRGTNLAYLKSSDLSVSPEIRKTMKLLIAWTTRTSPTAQLATTRPGRGQAIARAAARLKLNSMKLLSTNADVLALMRSQRDPVLLLVLLGGV
jgi:hypothetical protein